MKKNLLYVCFFIVFISLLIVVVVNRYTSLELRDNQVVNIYVFKRLIKIPNSFLLQLGTNEMSLKRDNERIVIGHNVKEDLLTYLRKFSVSDSDTCGLKLLVSVTENIRSTLIYDANDHVWFVNVDPSIIEKVKMDLCR